jgi:hypothetical protein
VREIIIPLLQFGIYVSLAEAMIGEKTNKEVQKSYYKKSAILSKITKHYNLNKKKLKWAGPGKEGKSCEGNSFPLLLCARIFA